ncbi:410_t:CDS:1, partial [Dentiscutata heterogama]
VTSSDSNAISKENEIYQHFEGFPANDKERRKTLEDSLIELFENLKKFIFASKVQNAKKQIISKKKIEVIKNVLDKFLGEVDVDMSFEVVADMSLDEETEHFFRHKVTRAAMEAFLKLVLPPMNFYWIYRDYKEVESRTSLKDMEKTIENLEKVLKVLKEKEKLLIKEHEKIIGVERKW